MKIGKSPRHQMILAGQKIHFLLFCGEIQPVNNSRTVFSGKLNIKTVVSLLAAEFTEIPVQFSAFVYGSLLSADTNCFLTKVLNFIQNKVCIFPNTAVHLSAAEVFFFCPPRMKIQCDDCGSIIVNNNEDLQHRRTHRIGKLKIQQKLMFLMELTRKEKDNGIFCQRTELLCKRISKIILLKLCHSVCKFRVELQCFFPCSKDRSAADRTGAEI